MQAIRPANHRMSLAEWAMLLTLGTLWGASFFFNAIAVRELPVLTIVALRVMLAALFLLVLIRVTGQRMPRDRRIWAAFLGMGLLNNAIPFTLIVWGQRDLASGVASILNASTPLFAVILAHPLTTDERMTPGRAAGVLTGFAGVAVMIGAEAAQGLGSHAVAQLLCLGAALAYAFGGLYGRRFRRLGVTPMATAAGQVAASSLILLPLALVIDRPWTLAVPGGATIGALAALGIVSTGLAYILYFRILATAGATNLMLVTFIAPVGAILLGVLFLEEVLLPRHLAGMALIALGLAAIDGRAAGLLSRRR